MILRSTLSLIKDAEENIKKLINDDIVFEYVKFEVDGIIELLEMEHLSEINQIKRRVIKNV